MREIIEEANEWRNDGKPIALATVVKTWGSAPRKVGAKMAISAEGAMAGSVSGGCVEGAVVESALATIEASNTTLLEFGVADETAWTVGLACGGMIDVFVEPFDAAIQRQVDGWIANDEAGAVISILKGMEDVLGKKATLHNGVWSGGISAELDPEIEQIARAALSKRKHQRAMLSDEQTEIFVDVIMPPPTLIIVGGVHIAQALIEIAQVMGFKPIIIDPRRAFGSSERFPDVQLLQEWPRKAFPQLTINQSTAIALLTHDPKIDDQALAHVLTSRAFYIGALGSKKTAAKRHERLLAEGYDEGVIGRIHGPIGLNINAQTPEEIALAVMGEIIAAYRQ